VILDVVYNHIGAGSDQRSTAFGPYTTSRAPDVLGRGDRLLAAGRARVGDARTPRCGSATTAVDGLRLDAVHAIVDDSPEHVLAELARG
jgi:maltooligosyltrehalose trehalohydrolase